MIGNMSEQQPAGAAPTEAADAAGIGYDKDVAEAGSGCSTVSRRIRVTVIDDHEMFRRGVIAAISGACDVVSEAGDVEGAVAAISRTQPDVVLLDVHRNNPEKCPPRPSDAVSCVVCIGFPCGCGRCDPRRGAGLCDKNDHRGRPGVIN